MTEPFLIGQLSANVSGFAVPGAVLVPQLSFLSPARLWLLLLIPALVTLYLLLNQRKSQQRKRASQGLLDYVIPREKPWKRHLAVGLSILSLLTLTLAFARPKSTVMENRQRATVVVTLDVSYSMRATDIKPNRLKAAKDSAVKFVQQLPNKFNVSVVEFAGSAKTRVPPTRDHGSAKSAIKNMKLQPSTAIGEGIYTSLDALKQVPKDPKHSKKPPPARIVLLSDGATQIGRPSAQAAKNARAKKVPIYTIAYGTPDGYIEQGGRRQPVPVDRAELANVSKISGGEAYRAQSTGQLHKVYKDIGSSVGKAKVDREISRRYAGYGLIFAVLAALGAISLGARWP